MPSAEAVAAPGLTDAAAGVLLDVAWRSIEAGLCTGRALAVEPEDWPAALRAPGASFVSLHRSGSLRGCTGSLEVSRPLVADVAANAYGSANEDPRFRPLEAWELDGLDVSVSVLGPLERLPVESEAQLLARLRPGVDGLVLRCGTARATFLPAVWRMLPEPVRFLAELRRKAGLPADHWSDELAFERYTVQEIGKRP